MGYVADWNRQNMKKSGAKGPTTKESRKDLGSLFHSSPAPQSKARPVRLADGDTEETYKARGLQASANDKVGLFERLRMGNIDQEGSEAYNRFGAGRAKGDDAQAAREKARFDRQAEANRSVEAPRLEADDSGNRASVSSFRVDNKDYAPITTRESLASPDADFPPSRGPAVAGPLSESTGPGRDDVRAEDQSKMVAPRTAVASAAGSSSAPAKKTSGNRPTTNAGGAAPSRSTPPMKSIMTDRSFDAVEKARLDRNSRPAPTLEQAGRRLVDYGLSGQLRDKIARGERLDVMEEARAKAIGLK
jgi:hypothetical protein